ncbi:orotate phosphoribosyltransferase [Plastoroseomonas hellenica]|uniref:orotate phosphoribosyltransferase n=1 Tax=Plastoroseomonas hellenica TaxID=2687306 RepID=UPI001BA51A52|nr:orotate phosphoribosyltransferase [Plastoroseomonas hellenica]MBR0641642.1 orotate phosphoribosyltransferase [Plastoroseomonas hellenica]
MTGTDATADLGAAMAKLLLQAGAIQVSRDRPFVLAAGWASPVYVDCRRLIGAPRQRAAVTALVLTDLTRRFGAELPFDAIAGGETAGIPWATVIADRLGMKLLYVRKRPLGIGRNAQVEGAEATGARVLLIDDLATDMASKLAFARGLRMAGAIVTDAWVLFHNQAFPGGEERLAQAGLALHALARWPDVLRLDAQERLLDPADRAVIERFLADPAAWSAEHGGRRAPAKPMA